MRHFRRTSKQTDRGPDHGTSNPPHLVGTGCRELALSRRQSGRMGLSVGEKERRRYVTTGNGAVRLFGLALATVSAAARSQAWFD